MPIDPAAIERFLNKPLPLLPQFKGADPASLQRLIYDSTGQRFQEKTQSRYYQLEGTAFALYKRRALLLFWMRSGKSKIGLDWMSHLRRAGLAKGKGLIIAHGPMGVDVWEGQVTAHSNLIARPIRSGPDAGDDFTDALVDDSDLLIIAWPTLQTLFSTQRLSRKGVPKLYPDHQSLHLASELISHAIVDETHFCMDWTSLRFAIGSELLAGCKQRLGLTGTPIGRDPFAIWPQAYLIDEGVTLGYKYYFFEEAFRRKKRGYMNQAVFDKSKMSILTAKLASISLSYGKGEIKQADVLDGIIELKMMPEQKQAYNDAIDKLIKVGGEEREIEAIFIRLRQIASGYLPFSDDEGDKRIVHFDSAKLRWLREFADELPAEMQGIIFHEFVHSGELICETLKKAQVPHAWIYGETPDRWSEVARFQNGEARILVANTRTGGTSIDLPQADYLCFFESPTSPIVREQAQARPMARALDRPLLMDDLICAPVEAKILGFIKEGRDLLRALTQGGRRLGNMLRAH